MDILNRDEKGFNKQSEFATVRLTPTAEMSIWDTVKKLRLQTFNSCLNQRTIKVNNKTIVLREDCNLLTRMLVIMRSRPELAEKLPENIGMYEMSLIPRSLFEPSGKIRIPKDKSAFMKYIREYKSDVPNAFQYVPVSHVIILDAMSIVQGIKIGNLKSMLCYSQFFVQKIGEIVDGYDEVRVIFDNYEEAVTLKQLTREIRLGKTVPRKYNISDTMNIEHITKEELLSYYETKDKLTKYLSNALLLYYENSEITIVVACGHTTTSNKPNAFNPRLTTHGHSEADTQIPMHVLDVLSQEIRCQIDVWCSDTDVLVHLLDLTANYIIPGQLRLLTCHGPIIDVKERCAALGNGFCRSLIGLHNISGADWEVSCVVYQKIDSLMYLVPCHLMIQL